MFSKMKHYIKHFSSLLVWSIQFLVIFFSLFTGLWYYVGGRDHPCLTLIGSPNFGYRSVHRDLEAQIAIVTENEELQMQLQQVGLPLRHRFLGYWAHITHNSCVGMFNSCWYYLWFLWLIIFVRVYWKNHKDHIDIIECRPIYVALWVFDRHHYDEIIQFWLIEILFFFFFCTREQCNHIIFPISNWIAYKGTINLYWEQRL